MARSRAGSRSRSRRARSTTTDIGGLFRAFHERHTEDYGYSLPEVLALLEQGDQAAAAARLAHDLPLFRAHAPSAPAAPEPAPDPLRTRLAAVNPDDLTPRAALELIYTLHAGLDDDETPD